MTEREKSKILVSEESNSAASSASSVLNRIPDLLHDLRTPMVAIRGYARMVLEGRVGPLNSTQQEYLAIVAENASKIIEQLKNFEHDFEKQRREGTTLEPGGPDSHGDEDLNRVVKK